MATLGKYEYTIEEGETRTVTDGTRPLVCVTIKNAETGQAVKLNNITNCIEREDWLEIAFNETVKTLTDTPNCCLTGQVEWVSE